MTGSALAAPTGGHHDAYPSKHQVAQAQADVAKKRTDVAAVRADLAQAMSAANAADQRAEIAAEAYNGALWRLSLAKKASTHARQEATAARQRVVDQRAGIANLVVQSYQDGTSLNTVTAMLGAQGPEGVMARTSVVTMAGASLQADYERYLSANAAAERAEAKAQAALSHQRALAASAEKDRSAAAGAAMAAENLASQVSSRRDELVKALAKAEHTSVGLARQRQAALEEIAKRRQEARAAAEARRAAAEARKAAQQRRQDQQNNAPSPAPVGGPIPPVSSSPPATQAGAAAAIAYAKAQIGKPYEWAGAGPNTFDCSGLTMRAWQRGGISLPHFAEAQYYEGTPISIGNLQPGDLIFWSYNGAPSGIHHVALYIGNGEFIEAPHTGAYVRYNWIAGDYPDFAVRL